MCQNIVRVVELRRVLLVLPVVESFEEVLVGQEDVDVWQGELDGAEGCARGLVFVLLHVVTRAR